MAEQSWPYAGDAVTEAEWSAMSRLWRRSGVVDGAADELEVTPVAGNLQVQVAAGEAWLDGFYYQSDSVVSLPLATADLSDDRVDLVVVRSDRNEGEARLAVKEGTPAASPVAPTVEQDHAGSGIFEIGLAEVTVAAAAGNVDGQVEDVRVFSLVPQDDIQLSSIDDGGADQGQALTYDGTSWVPATAGQILQVVTSQPSGTATTTAGFGNEVSAGLSATITPKSSSSKIIVDAKMSVNVSRVAGMPQARSAEIVLSGAGESDFALIAIRHLESSADPGNLTTVVNLNLVVVNTDLSAKTFSTSMAVGQSGDVQIAVGLRKMRVIELLEEDL